MGPYRCGVALERTSGYEKFEGPDPAEWVERGYAIINPDARGAGFSEGDIALWGEQVCRHENHGLIIYDSA
jgi:predicted acyl esterase